MSSLRLNAGSTGARIGGVRHPLHALKVPEPYHSIMANPLHRPTPVPVVATRRTPQVERLKLLTRLLDNAFQIPGTQFRIGLDAIVGIIPGIGDAIGAVFSAFIVFQAARLGVSRATLARMMGNVVLDTVIGEIPLLGDLFDAGWKANTKNMALLEAHLDRPAATGRSSRMILVLLGSGLLVLLAGVIALGVLVAKLVVVQMR
jgi:hypothetical protein